MLSGLLRRLFLPSLNADIIDRGGAIFRRVGAFSAREVARFGAPSLITRTTNDVSQVQMVVLMGATLLVLALYQAQLAAAA